jgi:hypothetical protein
MKRCPECHFTCDDYEQVCDFDGSELTPFPESSGPKLAPPLPFYVRVFKSPVGVTLLAIVALVISSLVVGYLDATSQPGVESPQAAESSASEVGIGSPVQTRTTSKSRSRRTSRQRSSKQLRSSTKSRSRLLTARSRKARCLPATVAKASPRINRQKAASARWQPRSTRTASGHAVAVRSLPRKNDSKVSAMFKKTGSVLKKSVSFLKRPFDL